LGVKRAGRGKRKLRITDLGFGESQNRTGYEFGDNTRLESPGILSGGWRKLCPLKFLAWRTRAVEEGQLMHDDWGEREEDNTKGKE